MQKNNLTKNTSNGFTLIELLVVIAIIGILGAIVYAPFQTARRKGRDASRVIEMKNLVSSLALYADSHNGFFPCDLNVLKNSQDSPLPVNANLSSDINNINSLYDYVGYTDGTQDISGYSGSCPNGSYRVIGYHLWTHLETASAALAGAAKCWGFSSQSHPNPIACVNVAEIGQNFGLLSGQTEPPDGIISGTDAFSTTSRQVIYSGNNAIQGDADSVCATNQLYCILDYHQ